MSRVPALLILAYAVGVVGSVLLADARPQPSQRVVKTKYGSLRGLVFTPASRTLPPVEVYLGVPYAMPPIGSLRFMPPMTPPPWVAVKNADHFGQVCPQRIPDIVNETEALQRMPRARLELLKRIVPFLQNYSEDCLTLNIYSPIKAGREGSRIPVMVYIHGESFEWNSGNPYDGSVLAGFGDVVVVTINYRLGVFGFLSTESDASRGNYGLMDQVAALHWIQENIQGFGGDPKNVTIFGHDYGAACVNFLMISPVARGLFQRVILQSGSALAHWALVREPLKYAIQLATGLECPRAGPQYERDEIVKCLRSLPVEDILDVNVVAPEHLTAFGPTIGGTVIPSDPEKMMQNIQDQQNGGGGGGGSSGPPVTYDLLFGVTSTEGTFPFGQDELIRGFEADKRERITRTFVRNIYTFHMNEILAVLTNEYTDWTKPVQHPINTRDATMEMLGDAQYVAPLVRAGILHSIAHANTYFYVFEYQTKDGDYPQRLGCFHGEELPYIFGVPLLEGMSFFHRNYSKSEHGLSDGVIRFWTNFAKTGDPNDPEKQSAPHNNRNRNRFTRVSWPQFEHVHQKFLSLEMRPKVRHHYRAHKLSVWLRLLPEIHRVGGGSSSVQHHLLDNHEDPSTFEGRVRALPIPWPTLAAPMATSPPPLLAGNISRNNGSDLIGVGLRPTSGGDTAVRTAGPGAPGDRGRWDPTRNGTDPLRVEPMQPTTYSTALSVTIAVGCSLLILNVLIFAGVYYQRDKNRIQAKLQDRAAYHGKKEGGLDEPAVVPVPPQGLGTLQKQPPPRTPPPSPVAKVRQGIPDYVDQPNPPTGGGPTLNLPRKPGQENTLPESQPLLLQNAPPRPPLRKSNMQEVRV